MSRVIDAVLRLRDEFTQPMGKSIDMLTKASKAGNNARKSVANLGAGLERMGKTMTAAVTVPAVGLGITAVKSFGSVDKSLRLVEATMGEAAWASADLTGAIKEAASNSVFSMQEAADASLNFARQGFDAAQAADMLAPALNLAAGTATDLNTVTSGLGNTLKAFSADSSEAAHYADMMAKAQASANTSTEGLFEAMSVAGPIAKTVGWEFEDIATLVGVFGDASIDASEGANALKTGLARLSGSNSTANKAMARLGINLFDDAGNMKVMVDVIDTLQQAFSGMTQEEQLFNAAQLFGQNQMSKWLALINGPGVESLSEMRDSISGVDGTARDMSDALLSGVGGSIEKLSSTFDVFKFTLGETLSGYVQPLLEGLTNMIDRFNKMSPEQQNQIVKWVAMAAAVGPVLIVMGRMATTAYRVFTIMSKVSKAGGLVKYALAGITSPAGIVVGALAGVAAIALVVLTHFDQFKEAGAKLAEKVAPSVAKLGEAFTGLWNTVSPVIAWISDLVANVLVNAFQGASDGIALIIDGLVFIIDGISKTIQGVVDFVVGITTGDWDRAWSGLSSVVEGVCSIMTGVVEGVVGAVEAVVGAVNNAIGGIQNLNAMAPSAGTKAVDRVTAHAKGTPNFEGGWTRVNEKGGEIINLPSGSQIIPHEASLNRGVGGGISIAKLADQIVVREDADIDRIASAIVQKVKQASTNRGGWTFNGNMA
ncbi:MAG: phage tail tape measure protein [Eubacterium sp.]|nr:phage tail tape measure protein [Candidatus Colimonas fimequi]